MGYSRLDDRYIEDDIFRALFHQEMIKRVSEYHSDNFQYTIKIDEVYRSDLAAYRAYGNADLRWVFRVPAGTTLTLPDVAWLRNKIRDYASAEPEIENA